MTASCEISFYRAEILRLGLGGEGTFCDKNLLSGLQTVICDFICILWYLDVNRWANIARHYLKFVCVRYGRIGARVRSSLARVGARLEKLEP